ncbi:MAG TPA: ABC transporter permease, partial [Candidatus Solibacter sp.]|nr:ABC transporter permease [Candidatus Solibacter sp.]
MAVISHELWQARFGRARDIPGRTVRLSAKTYQIIGVMPPGFELRIIDQATSTQFYALMQKDEEPWRSGGKGPVAAIGRLKPGVGMAAAQTELQAIQRGLDERYGDNPKGYTVLLSGLQQDNTRTVRASLWMAGAAAGTMLLIVCANIGGLLLGRGMEREREMAVRA